MEGTRENPGAYRRVTQMTDENAVEVPDDDPTNDEPTNPGTPDPKVRACIVSLGRVQAGVNAQARKLEGAVKRRRSPFPR